MMIVVADAKAFFRSKDFISGVFFIACGATFYALGRGYAMGTDRNMRPGYFPSMLSIILIIIGIALAVRAAFKPGAPTELPAFGKLAVIGAGVSGTNLLYCLIGAFVGTLIGVLPGLGPAATVAMLMPTAFTLPPLSALIMLSGIYYGAQYGGSTTPILVNLPGEASSIVTTLDGYQMP